MYNSIGSPMFGVARIGLVASMAFISSNPAVAASVHSKCSVCYSAASSLPLRGNPMQAQEVALHKAAEQAMRGLIVRMWPGDSLPNSYFGLVRRLVDACPWLEVIKRSVCIEGARRAFARAKVHWAKMDAEKLVKEGPPQGKEHRHPEMYYEGVLKGAHLVADECAKDVIFE